MGGEKDHIRPASALVRGGTERPEQTMIQTGIDDDPMNIRTV